MSARSTGMFSLMHRYCCFTREPQLCSMLKLTPPELSVAENTLTGIDTRPKLSDREAMERAAMVGHLGAADRGLRLPTSGRLGSIGAGLGRLCDARTRQCQPGLRPSFFIAAVSVCRQVQ